MQAVDDKRADQFVVYKIDRLTRSLADFAKLVERLDQVEASFASVTQSFNTATSMGRLTLNVLLSFAQFVREVTAERIRDKIAASKRKGLWMGGNVPLGYEADGRTLKIDEDEAKTIRALYDLCLEHGLIRVVKDCAEDLGLRSRERVRGVGRVSGGKLFDSGHIHYLLNNPIYAGRIRHKGQVYEGQHAAIIDPKIRDQVQQMHKDGAQRTRGTTRKATRSLLARKLFDETGDRLTPSHSRKNGKRLRYYISHRLVKDRSRKHLDAWRLPADQLERLIADLVRQHVKRPDIAMRLIRDLAASHVTAKSAILQAIRQTTQCLHLIERADLSPGEMSVRLCQSELASVLEFDADRINTEELILMSPFQMRRRGVELKLHLGDAPPEVDLTLFRSIVKAQRWMAMIIAGKTFTEIAQAEGTSKRRLQDIVDLAMLAPDILDSFAAGEQSEDHV